MSPLLALLLGAVLGAVLGAALVLRARRRGTGAAGDRTRASAEEGTLPDRAVVQRLLDAVDPAVLLVAADDSVLLANASARRLGIVRRTRLQVPELLDLVHDVAAGSDPRAEVRLPGELAGSDPRLVGVRGVRLGGDGFDGGLGDDGSAPVVLVLQDLTEARRVEAVRRDFVANVSHELKTPVGALALLAEAILGAADDPETVQRFASRMAHEADRLGRLVGELIDLSRLQGGEPMPTLEPVDVDTVLAEAVDRTRMAAAAKQIEIAVGGVPGLVVPGVESQLITAVTNLLGNAVTYSPQGTRIAVAARARAGSAEIVVTDSGIGIPREDRNRIFERFYRVDQSRASTTGGTGLGLAIVKHVASNHGGSVSVWSEEGLGSTFTLRIPLAAGAGRAGRTDGREPAVGRGRA